MQVSKAASKSTNVLEIKVGIEDMVLLRDSKDSGIVENLKARLAAAQIYTYIGPVLIACNPYKWLNIYDEVYVKKYKFQNRNDAHPHIYMTAEAAYRGMITEEENQCVIISGESGAGKTEASKHIQNYIAAVSGGGASVDALKETFLRSNPVLEAFGNAKTLRNNNSSRFGKYFELKFDPFGSPKGGVITNYLLEKSRIVCPGEGERGFHIFYQLLASPLGRSLGLSSNAKDYSFLAMSSCSTVEGMNDATEFQDTYEAMQSVGMDQSQIQQILNLVAAVLLLGNVKFISKQEGDLEGSECSKVETSTKALQSFADLASIDADTFIFSITHREMQTMAAGGKTETYQVPQNPVQASTRRDAVAKAFYERLFNLIVIQINASLDPGEEANESGDMLSIGVLDIYGFEIFLNNGFEQLCINYVNEKLQQIFIELTLRAEQDEYEREGIQWTPIPFFNNRIVCELLDGLSPPGLFRILDDTCKTLHGSKDNTEIDRKFVESVTKFHGTHAHFAQNSSSNSRTFTIKHYAGEVVYTLAKFGESNKDALNKDIVLMLQTTANNMMSHLFNEDVDLNDKKAAPTAGYRIRTQCQALVSALMECSPHYVRCIKSNEIKQALTTDTKRVQHQVKYLGLAENIKVRRAGYAYRAEYSRFLDRFAIMDPGRFNDWQGVEKVGCQELLKVISTKMMMQGVTLAKDEAQLGRTMIFIRKPETYFLIEQIREQMIGENAIKIQKTWKMYSQRREFINLQLNMTKLFSENNKMRRRESIMRPYYGDYIQDLPSNSHGNSKNPNNSLKKAIYRILHYYNKEEKIIFSELYCYQIVATIKAPYWKYTKRILILTDAAVYLMEYLSITAKEALNKSKASCIPDVILRRRIAFKDQSRMAVLEAFAVTTLPDACVTLFLKPVERIKEPYVDPHWPERNSVKICSISNKSFSMFDWRKQCKVTGNIHIDSVCDYEQTMPDTGYYTPDRCNDHSIGLVSTDQAEDILLYLDKKTEFIALLSVQWRKTHVGTLRPSAPLSFSSEQRLRPGPDQALCTLPARQIIFTPAMTDAHINANILATTGGSKSTKGNNSDKNNRSSGSIQKVKTYGCNEVNENDLQGFFDRDTKDASKTTLTFTVALGVAAETAEYRRVRQEEKRRVTDVIKAQAIEDRKIRNAARAHEREQERLYRIAEKKERKRLEKEAKLNNPTIQSVSSKFNLRNSLMSNATGTTMPPSGRPSMSSINSFNSLSTQSSPAVSYKVNGMNSISNSNNNSNATDRGSFSMQQMKINAAAINNNNTNGFSSMSAPPPPRPMVAPVAPKPVQAGQVKIVPPPMAAGVRPPPPPPPPAVKKIIIPPIPVLVAPISSGSNNISSMSSQPQPMSSMSSYPRPIPPSASTTPSNVPFQNYTPPPASVPRPTPPSSIASPRESFSAPRPPVPAYVPPTLSSASPRDSLSPRAPQQQSLSPRPVPPSVYSSPTPPMASPRDVSSSPSPRPPINPSSPQTTSAKAVVAAGVASPRERESMSIPRPPPPRPPAPPTPPQQVSPAVVSPVVVSSPAAAPAGISPGFARPALRPAAPAPASASSTGAFSNPSPAMAAVLNRASMSAAPPRPIAPTSNTTATTNKGATSGSPTRPSLSMTSHYLQRQPPPPDDDDDDEVGQDEWDD